MTEETLLQLLKSKRFDLHNEKEIQNQIELALLSKAIPHNRAGRAIYRRKPHENIGSAVPEF